MVVTLTSQLLQEEGFSLVQSLEKELEFLSRNHLAPFERESFCLPKLCFEKATNHQIHYLLTLKHRLSPQFPFMGDRLVIPGVL